MYVLQGKRFKKVIRGYTIYSNYIPFIPYRSHCIYVCITTYVVERAAIKTTEGRTHIMGLLYILLCVS